MNMPLVPGEQVRNPFSDITAFMNQTGSLPHMGLEYFAGGGHKRQRFGRGVSEFGDAPLEHVGWQFQRGVEYVFGTARPLRVTTSWILSIGISCLRLSIS